MFGRSRSVRLSTVSGIRVGVDVSWFVILFLLIYVLSPRFRVTLDSSDMVAYLTTVVTVLALFASILVHEFGHALAAKWRGVGVTAIDLNLFGGLTAMDREPSTPSDDFTIAVAGPLATVAVILVCIGAGIAVAGGHRLDGAIGLRSDLRITPVLLGLSWMIPLNIGLLAFNLLPALPLDGGRIARSVVWGLTGERRRGTVVSARLGQLLAAAMTLLGVWLLLHSGSLSGIYALLLAWILWTSARAEIARAELDERVEGVPVSDIMDPHPVAIDAELPAERAGPEQLERHGWPWCAVVEADGRLLGIVRAADVRAAIEAGEGWMRTGSLADPDPAWRIEASRPLTDLLGSEAMRALGAALVVDGDGRLCGVVTLQQVSRALGPVSRASAA